MMFSNEKWAGSLIASAHFPLPVRVGCIEMSDMFVFALLYIGSDERIIVIAASFIYFLTGELPRAKWR